MYFTVYKTTNLLNGKFYVGMHKTSNIDDEYLGSGKVLLNAIKKYGKENFKKEVLFVFDNEEDMKEKEKEIVTEEFLKNNDVYNLCEGGKGGFSYIEKNQISKFKGKKHKEETKERIRTYMKTIPSRFPKTPWNKDKKMNSSYKLSRSNKVCSEEKKEKLSNALKGKIKEKSSCPYCNGFFAKNMLKRWHGENCFMRK